MHIISNYGIDDDTVDGANMQSKNNKHVDDFWTISLLKHSRILPVAMCEFCIGKGLIAVLINI